VVTALLWYLVVTGALGAVLLLVMSVQAALLHLHLHRPRPQVVDPFPAEPQPSRPLESAA
jgi:hypothetical protein